MKIDKAPVPLVVDIVSYFSTWYLCITEKDNNQFSLRRQVIWLGSIPSCDFKKKPLERAGDENK